MGLFNARSMRNKLTYIAETLREYNLDVLCITETWLLHSDIDVVRAALPNSYSLFHVPRTLRRGVELLWFIPRHCQT